VTDNPGVVVEVEELAMVSGVHHLNQVQ